MASDPASLVHFDVTRRQRQWRTAVNAMRKYIATVAQRLVESSEPAESRALLEPFEFGATPPPVELFGRIAEALACNQSHPGQPCYFGPFNCAPAAMAIAADALMVAFDPQHGLEDDSPFAIELERHIVLAFAERFGHSRDTAAGLFTTGGTEANGIALFCALLQRWPWASFTGLRTISSEPILYLSHEAHASFERAARMTRSGPLAVRRIAVRPDLTMDVGALRAAIHADRAWGRTPFLVVATAGTTAAGAIDPLPELAELAAEEKLWLHVDAVWGGAARLVPRVASALRGIERADSIAFVPNKWLAMSPSTGLFLTRHPGALSAAYALDAPDLVAGSPQAARRLDGLKSFMTLAAAGWSGCAAALEYQIEMANLLRRRLSATGWDVLNTTPLPVVCFAPRWTTAPQRAALDAVAEAVAGRAELSTVLLNGRPALRACVTDVQTGPEHIEILIDALRRANDGNT